MTLTPLVTGTSEQALLEQEVMVTMVEVCLVITAIHGPNSTGNFKSNKAEPSETKIPEKIGSLAAEETILMVELGVVEEAEVEVEVLAVEDKNEMTDS
ncbi:hypothetical protein WICPIJ_010048 [Wickerhamomyces pijperi]|uniref:Uncharacterized protein n=1 Tax=Wickerhamomyces pijperi TaxID=599730 RepID=A0A9P8PJJ0_WICPI|nr:hypothetical protein WICPIJ_010048 [Wickerhamomyces pijperi]